MAEAIRYSSTGDKLGMITLPESLFEVKRENAKALLYEVINMYLANQRQGTSSVKNRSKVSGSTKKLYRQKGTGSARPGSRRTPIRVGGGVAFGPLPRDWYSPIPKKKKRLALKLALSERANQNQILVVDKIEFEKPNTKAAVTLLNKIAPEARNILVIVDGSDVNVIKSFSNIENVKMDRADGIFAYEILRSKCLVMTEGALKKVEEVFANEK